MCRLTEFAGMPSRRAAAAKLAARTTSTNRNTWFRSRGGLLRFLDFIHPIMPYSQVIIGPLCSAESVCNPRTPMARVLVLYYSSYGHVETMANAVAEGARSAGANVMLKRVPETAPAEAAKAAHFKLDQVAAIATIEELTGYDAIIIGC